MPRPLTPRMTSFIQAYAQGISGAEAARQAGYAPKDAKRQAAKLLARADVQTALAELGNEAKTEAVLTLSELQEWWTRVVQGHEVDAEFRDKIKCSELLGKSLGAFVDRQEHSGGMTIEVVYVDDTSQA